VIADASTPKEVQARLNRNRIVVAIVVILVVSTSVLVTIIAGMRPYPASTSTVSTICMIPVESGLTVHVADENGKPISNAKVLLNTTYACAISNLSGTTDSDGNVEFSVTPVVYNVTVVPPRTSQAEAS
jgi:hypothetical protein